MVRVRVTVTVRLRVRNSAVWEPLERPLATPCMVGEEKAWFSEEALRQKATW